CGILRGGGDGLGDHLLVVVVIWWLGQQFAPEVLQSAQRLGGHRQPSPALGRPVQDRPHQRQAAVLAGQAADHLDAAPCLTEGPLDQVGVAGALVGAGGGKEGGGGGGGGGGRRGG